MILSLSHISRSYGGKAILSDCTYSFDAGGTYVLMGPNGSGKSTLLRICALLERPDGGDLRFQDGDRPAPQDLALRRRVTLVLPRIGVFNTTVFRNVAYGLKLRGALRGDIDERVERVLAFVGLAHKARQQARTLSSGETQRLGIARALVIGPEILFLDEPTASVDQENTVIIEKIIAQMKSGGGTTVIMTTHDREQAERLADRLLLLHRGRLEEEQISR